MDEWIQEMVSINQSSQSDCEERTERRNFKEWFIGRKVRRVLDDFWGMQDMFKCTLEVQVGVSNSRWGS